MTPVGMKIHEFCDQKVYWANSGFIMYLVLCRGCSVRSHSVRERCGVDFGRQLQQICSQLAHFCAVCRVTAPLRLCGQFERPPALLQVSTRNLELGLPYKHAIMQ